MQTSYQSQFFGFAILLYLCKQDWVKGILNSSVQFLELPVNLHLLKNKIVKNSEYLKIN